MTASSEIRLGRRALEGLHAIEVLSDVERSSSGWYYFRVRLTIDAGSQYVPNVTDWFVLVERDYPIGRVRLCPAELGGLQSTFRHMERNDSTGGLWRSGSPCLDRAGRWLGSRELVQQPTSANARIRWHVERCLEWLAAAASDNLTEVDEPFELPKFPLDDDGVLGFDEDPQRFSRWKPLLGRAGRASVTQLSKTVRAAYVFFVRDDYVAPPRWGNRLAEIEDREHAFWITFNDVPIRAPWYVPATWGELRGVAKTQKIDLDGHLRWIYHQLHKLNIRTESTLLVGFPIPQTYNAPAVRMHWQWVTLPPPIDTSSKSFHVRKGSKASAGAWSLERLSLFGDDKTIRWRKSECWAEDRLAVRGAFSQTLRQSRVVILGCGALGSAVSSFLVREGVNDVILCDHETLEVGNIRRHSLTMTSAEYDKALALSVHLNAASPFANVRYAGAFPGDLRSLREAIRDADVVIDCTASDDVIARMQRFDWADRERWFFSASIGVDARRLFCFTHHGVTFPAPHFFDSINPHLTEERALLQERDPQLLFVAGCWNPVFPARWDHISALAADLTAMIDSSISGSQPSDGLVIVER